MALVLAFALSSRAAQRDYRFDGRISREVLDNYLSRAVTFTDFLHGKGSVADNLRFLTNTGAKLVGRAIYRWGGEEALPALLETAQPIARQAHAADADTILQAACFEIVTTNVGKLPVPEWLFRQSSWFAHQPESYRNEWLRYAWKWLREHDPNGWLEMPGSRTLHAPIGNQWWYWANTRSTATPEGFNQEETIKAIWAQDVAKRDLLSHHPDFVVVEYAVNDPNTQAAAESLEGLIRQIVRGAKPARGRPALYDEPRRRQRPGMAGQGGTPLQPADGEFSRRALAGHQGRPNEVERRGGGHGASQ